MTDDNAIATLNQTAPYPIILADLVKATDYKAGWQFSLLDIDRGQGSRGMHEASFRGGRHSMGHTDSENYL